MDRETCQLKYHFRLEFYPIFFLNNNKSGMALQVKGYGLRMDGQTDVYMYGQRDLSVEILF